MRPNILHLTLSSLLTLTFTSTACKRAGGHGSSVKGAPGTADAEAPAVTSDPAAFTCKLDPTTPTDAANNAAGSSMLVERKDGLLTLTIADLTSFGDAPTAAAASADVDNSPLEPSEHELLAAAGAKNLWPYVERSWHFQEPADGPTGFVTTIASPSGASAAGQAGHGSVAVTSSSKADGIENVLMDSKKTPYSTTSGSPGDIRLEVSLLALSKGGGRQIEVQLALPAMARALKTGDGQVSAKPTAVSPSLSFRYSGDCTTVAPTAATKP